MESWTLLLVCSTVRFKHMLQNTVLWYTEHNDTLTLLSISPNLFFFFLCQILFQPKKKSISSHSSLSGTSQANHLAIVAC